MTKTKTETNQTSDTEISPGFINPETVVTQWNIGPEDKIADLGCGSGYFSIPLAKIVGEKGKIYAADVVEGPLESLRSRIFLEKLENIEVLRVNLEKKDSLKKTIPNGECKLVLLASVLYTSKNKKSILKEAKRILKPGGMLIVIDWKDKISNAFAFFGPPMELRISELKVKQLAKEEKLKYIENFEAGQFHYGIMFTKA